MLTGGNVRIAQGGVITKELAREGDRIHVEMTVAQNGGMLKNDSSRDATEPWAHNEQASQQQLRMYSNG